MITRLHRWLVEFGRAEQARETTRVAEHVAVMRNQPPCKPDHLPFLLDALAMFTRFPFTQS